MRGGRREFTPCAGSLQPAVQYRSLDKYQELAYGPREGRCRECGKWCRLQGDRVVMPGHKALSGQAWERHNENTPPT